jgi:hypothetical protein
MPAAFAGSLARRPPRRLSACIRSATALEEKLKRTILACGAAFLFGTGAAAAQSYQDTQPPAPVPSEAAPVPPPPGTLSTTHQVQAVDAYGNRYDKTSTTYRNSSGVAQDSTTTRTIVAAPPPPPPSYRSSTTTTTTTTAPQ